MELCCETPSIPGRGAQSPRVPFRGDANAKSCQMPLRCAAQRDRHHRLPAVQRGRGWSAIESIALSGFR